MAQKTPFEVRADLLRLAFEISMAKHHAIAASNDTGLTSPTTEEIITEADKLNEFVSKTGNPRYDK